MTDRMWKFLEQAVDEGFNRKDILDALCDGEVLGKIFPKWDTEEELAAQTAEVDEAFEEVEKWPEQFLFRYKIGFGNNNSRTDFVEVEAHSENEAEHKVLDIVGCNKDITYCECLGLANGNLEDNIKSAQIMKDRKSELLM